METRLCIPAGIPGVPRNPQEPGFQKTGTTEKAGQTAKKPSKTGSFFAGT
jgi:hypothetical protein